MLIGGAEEKLRAAARRVRLLMLDVDGVLTDGRIIYDSDGRDIKFFDVQDGLGATLLWRAGIPVVLVSAKSSKCIKIRAKDMHIEDVFEGVSSKSVVLTKVLKKYKVSADEVCFAGDDLVDVCVMKRVGFAVAVFNASPEVKQAADYITIKQGGRGAVREIAELILKSKGLWKKSLEYYDI